MASAPPSAKGPWGIIAVIAAIVLILVVLFVWPGILRSSRSAQNQQAVAEAPAPTERPAPRTNPAPERPRTVEVVTAGPALPDAPAEVDVDANVRRLINLLKERSPARDNGASMANFQGRSGARYRVYYTGDATTARNRTLTIEDLPTDYAAHDPASDVSRNALFLRDIGLDGAIDQGWNGGPYAAMARESQSYFQSDKVGDPVGSAHRERMQARFVAMIADILPAPPPAPAPAAAPAAPAQR